jgi:hypothetical protein
MQIPQITTCSFTASDVAKSLVRLVIQLQEVQVKPNLTCFVMFPVQYLSGRYTGKQQQSTMLTYSCVKTADQSLAVS